MATLDISNILLDPRFISHSLICHRYAVVVNGNGRTETNVTSSPFVGVVTTNNGLRMDRREDGTLIKGAINIHTAFQLIPGDAQTKADEIEWEGKTFIVSQVLSNKHYGRGFVKAICELKPLG